MNYVLINNIAAHTGCDAAHLRLPAAWARDLAATARAARASDIRLVVATPLTSTAAPSGTVEVVSDEVGFEHIAIPRYDSAQSFLHERGRLAEQLNTTIAAASVVQLDLGGHPVPLGLVAEPIAHELARPTLWMLGGDRSPDARLTARSRSAAKRMAGHALETRMRRVFTRATARASGIVTDNDKVAASVAKRCGKRPAVIESVDVLDEELVSSTIITQRHARLIDATRPLRIVLSGDLTIDRGTDHVLAAMHRCWRLRVPITLMLSDRGSEVDAVRRHAAELGLRDALTFSAEPNLEDADLLIDSSLSNVARANLDVAMARGVPAIAYAPRHPSPGVQEIVRGAVDELADALFTAGSDRASVASRMIAGHAWVRQRTLDAAHRARFALAREIARPGARGAA